MTLSRLFVIASSLAWLTLAGQQIPESQPRPRDDEGLRLPNGKNQKNEILKAEHVKNLKDAQKIADLGAELKTAIEKNTEFVVSVADLKRLDEIEKTAKRIRSRLKRY